MEKYRVKCLKCFRPNECCLCSSIIPFQTEAKFVVLIHPKEAKKNRIGTGRISHAFLKNSEMIMGVNFDDHRCFLRMIEDQDYFPVILYPGRNAFNISEDPLKEFSYPKEKKLLIFVVDATWPCAKKMMKLSLKLNQLPRICFLSDSLSLFSIKSQPHDLCLSTIESIHKLIVEMNRVGMEKTEGQEKQMLVSLRKLVDFQIECSLDPEKDSYRKGAFKDKELRGKSKKWSGRSIFYNSEE